MKMTDIVPDYIVELRDRINNLESFMIRTHNEFKEINKRLERYAKDNKK